MLIREYQPSDCRQLAELFYNTVHRINVKDYTKEQLDVWATGQIDLEKWNRSFQEHFSIVAVDDGIITDFGDIDRTGYLDRLYVHADYQDRGVATHICNRLEQEVPGNIVTHASITASDGSQAAWPLSRTGRLRRQNVRRFLHKRPASKSVSRPAEKPVRDFQ